MEQARLCQEPFLVALALADDYGQTPRKVRAFQGIFGVTSTGVQISPDGIETKVLRRARAADYASRNPRPVEQIPDMENV
jgi:hypothetical protein